ncbi:hypothetical protein HOD08_03995 [bacterium]|nr:hypothetical protein [bacterium]
MMKYAKIIVMFAGLMANAPSSFATAEKKSSTMFSDPSCFATQFLANKGTINCNGDRQNFWSIIQNVWIPEITTREAENVLLELVEGLCIQAKKLPSWTFGVDVELNETSDKLLKFQATTDDADLRQLETCVNGDYEDVSFFDPTPFLSLDNTNQLFQTDTACTRLCIILAVFFKHLGFSLTIIQPKVGDFQNTTFHFEEITSSHRHKSREQVLSSDVPAVLGKLMNPNWANLAIRVLTRLSGKFKNENLANFGDEIRNLAVATDCNNLLYITKKIGDMVNPGCCGWRKAKPPKASGQWAQARNSLSTQSLREMAAIKSERKSGCLCFRKKKNTST